MCITVLIAPSGLKECLSAHEVAAAMAIGVRRAWRDARIFEAPIADGGEGFTAALVRATNGTLHAVEVTGPTGAPVHAHIGFLGIGSARTAVVDIASAAGLALIPEAQRNPSETTSFGVGELVRAALDRRADRIIVGCGDSGVNDGGAGMAQALGAHLLDRNGRTIGRGGAALAELAGIDLSGLDARLAKVRIDAAVNPHNALLGARGVTRIYGPQKGARPDQIDVLERAMANFAQRLREATGVDVANLAGAGASGGIGAALAAICGTVLHPRYDIVMRYTCFDRLLPEADLVLTAEGSLDGQTPYGKIPAEVGRRAAAYGIPVIAFAGRIGEGAEANLDHGISAYRSINTRPMPLAEAMANAELLLASSVEQTLRAIGGRLLYSRIPSEPCAEPVLRRA
ncbi:MAG: glycerate kinase [Hyphomicrobium sp.]|nr:glycerate kinase [Hyphomicrobium sp.]